MRREVWGGDGDRVPQFRPLRRILLRGINGHATGGRDCFDRKDCCLARVMSVAAAARRTRLRLGGWVIDVPLSPSEGEGRKGNLNVGGRLRAERCLEQRVGLGGSAVPCAFPCESAYHLFLFDLALHAGWKDMLGPNQR